MALLLGYIGAYEMVRMTGNVNPMAEVVQTISRPGVDGVAVKRVSYKPDTFQFQTTGGVISDVALDTLRANYKALEGALVVITEQGLVGVTYANVLVQKVTLGAPIRVVSATDNYKWLLPATWTLLATESPIV